MGAVLLVCLIAFAIATSSSNRRAAEARAEVARSYEAKTWAAAVEAVRKDGQAQADRYDAEQTRREAAIDVLAERRRRAETAAIAARDARARILDRTTRWNKDAG